ncbi:hypothetical protein JCM10212_003982 [Sporobolomyces blumeae]
MTVLESLHHSRETLVRSAFEPFPSAASSSTSATQKTPRLARPPPPPPHELHHFATTNVTIGPHSFVGTRFYLVHWTAVAAAPLPPPAPASASAASSSTSPSSSSAKAAAPLGHGITPSVIKRLNQASQSDPALQALLRRAANGEATPDELADVSRKIEELRTEEEAAMAVAAQTGPLAAPPPVTSAAAATSATPPPPPPPAAAVPRPTHPSLAIEFEENLGERFLIPDHYLCVTLTPRNAPQTPSSTFAVLLSFFIFPRDRTLPKTHETTVEVGVATTNPPVPIDMIVEGCSADERDKLIRASRLGRPRDNGLETWWKNTIASVPPRVHVVHEPLPSLLHPEQDLSTTAGPRASVALSRTTSEAATTGGGGGGGGGAGGTSMSRNGSSSVVPLKRGASGTPSAAPGTGAAAAAAAEGGGGTPNAKRKPPATKRKAPTRSRSSTSVAPLVGRGGGAGNAKLEGSPFGPAASPGPSSSQPYGGSGSPAPPSMLPPLPGTSSGGVVGPDGGPGTTPGTASVGKGRAKAGAATTGKGKAKAKGKGKKKRKVESESDPDDWEGYRVIE